MKTNKFEIGNIEYNMNPETGYCTRTVKYQVESGETHRQSTRISKSEFNKSLKEYEEMMNVDMEEAIDRLTESMESEEMDQIRKEMVKPKKAPRKKKVQIGGMEFSEDGVNVILTAKQVDFIKHLSDTCFWENGMDSCIWIDCLCDEIGGQFENKPMTVGAMISTLCEKGLGSRGSEKRNGRKCTSFELTELGKKVAAGLGL